jgi:ribonuclease HI
MSKHDHVIIFTDGGSRGNPGPAALGFVITNPAGKDLVTRGEFLGETTNNVAEYTAVVHALREAQRLGARRVDCFMDSELVVRQLAGLYRVKNEKLKPLFEQVKTLACNFEQITFQHVPREKNSVADALLNEVLDEHARS